MNHETGTDVREFAGPLTDEDPWARAARPPLRGEPLGGVASEAAWEALAAQLMARSPGGRLLIAVDGVDAAARVHFATVLARALRAVGRPAVRLTAAPFTDDETVRTVVRLFRSDAFGGEFEDAPDDAALIVDGWSLLRGGIRDAWDFTVFLETRRLLDDDIRHLHRRYVSRDAPCAAADVAYDVTDIDRPQRIDVTAC
ncbi:hypothetical protein [Microbacterium sp. NPDC058345]|uniref:hypothetical protein n=1 Tax=Microbacterium sp. NPDC058345 TaxID=3346455 RepID=UPI0036564036